MDKRSFALKGVLVFDRPIGDTDILIGDISMDANESAMDFAFAWMDSFVDEDKNNELHFMLLKPFDIQESSNMVASKETLESVRKINLFSINIVDDGSDEPLQLLSVKNLKFIRPVIEGELIPIEPNIPISVDVQYEKQEVEIQ